MMCSEFGPKNKGDEGTEPKWSDEVFIVKAVRGNKIEN